MMNRSSSAGVVSGTLLCAGACFGAWNAGVQTGVKGDSIVYQLWIPASYSADVKYPVVITLHGAGERGTDNNKQVTFFRLTSQFTDTAFQKANPCIIIAPQCPWSDQWVNVPFEQSIYEQDKVPLSPSLSLVMSLLDETRKKYSVDDARIYVTGISMGGYGTWDLITRYPKKFAAAVPVCGGADPAKAPCIAHMPLWVFHTKDDPVVPARGSEMMVRALTEAKGNPKSMWHDKGGHDAWIWAYEEKTGVREWLFSKKLGI